MADQTTPKPKKSLRTSMAGLAAILTLVGAALTQLTDGDPATNPDWGRLLAEITIAGGLMFARDHRVSSSAAGVE
jgi:hypothetical protein